MVALPSMTEMKAPKAMTDDDRWRSVLARDGRMNGRFFTAVKSTGIFCLPSCAARHPKRENVEFFATAEEAKRASYRACLRCKPDDPDAQPATRIARACAYLESRAGENVPLDELSAAVGVSAYHLQRTFKQSTGMTPREYSAAIRLRRLKGGLRNGGSVTAAIYDAGYGSSSRAYEHSKQIGMTPGAYRNGAAGSMVRYDIVPSPLGKMLIAATDRGVCSIMFDDDESVLLREFRHDFHGAEIERDAGAVEAFADTVRRYLRGELERADVPLDIRATVFQRRVWRALQRIPLGKTKSYGQIAKEIGHPNAYRAVGTACGQNPISVVIPCHRAVRSDGSLAGFRWGLERKRRLQAMERERAGS